MRDYLFELLFLFAAPLGLLVGHLIWRYTIGRRSPEWLPTKPVSKKVLTSSHPNQFGLALGMWQDTQARSSRLLPSRRRCRRDL